MRKNSELAKNLHYIESYIVSRHVQEGIAKIPTEKKLSLLSTLFWNEAIPILHATLLILKKFIYRATGKRAYAIEETRFIEDNFSHQTNLS